MYVLAYLYKYKQAHVRVHVHVHTFVRAHIRALKFYNDRYVTKEEQNKLKKAFYRSHLSQLDVEGECKRDQKRD